MMFVRILLVLILVTLIGLLVLNNRTPRVRHYNCDIAEFHPDYPAAVKEECRKIRSNTKRVTT
jgi:hypothetical protein